MFIIGLIFGLVTGLVIGMILTWKTLRKIPGVIEAMKGELISWEQKENNLL